MIRILYGYTENGKMSSGMGPCPHGEMTAAAGDGPVKTGPSFFVLLPKNDCNNNHPLRCEIPAALFNQYGYRLNSANPVIASQRRSVGVAIRPPEALLITEMLVVRRTHQ